ncbi:TspO/MBR family protein [Algihabitans albus]|uniref:TspO/MBR family protein n=1 Tax=Algihabitans albus TaxID=2164067 RepID=UPI000E5CFCB6|nr:TspO/MBR family protein [Algihabitans albus]
MLRSTRRDQKLLPILVAAVVAVLVAALGSTMTDLGPWYQSLEQPSWRPPDWAFGVIWTVVLGLAVLSAATAWRAAPNRGVRDALLMLFLLNGLLNVLWSALFFTFRRPDWASIEVLFLWASIAVLIVILWRFARMAALLLVPYLAWVSVAAALNLAVVRMNPPFG